MLASHFPSRRSVLRETALGFGALALTDLLRAADAPAKKTHFATSLLVSKVILIRWG